MFLLLTINIHAQIGTVESLNNPIIAIDSLYKNYQNNFIRACYAIEELRYFAIISIDKIGREYRNEWISPDEIISKLTLKEHKQLIEALKKFITDIKDTKKATALLSKLNRWCILDLHLKFISKNYGIPLNKIIENVLQTSVEVKEPYTGLKINQTSYSPEQLYYLTLNQISSFAQKRVFVIYKQLFEQLSIQ